MAEIKGKAIRIKGKMLRSKIVQKVVNIFIENEQNQPRPGTIFLYPVEDLPKEKIFIRRPGGLQKWNFDFKVLVPDKSGLGKGTHAEMLAFLKMEKQENPAKFKALIKALTEIYDCSQNDVDTVLCKYPALKGTQAEIFLKVIKWMFIMEDIVYWNYKGRTKLYEYLIEGTK